MQHMPFVGVGGWGGGLVNLALDFFVSKFPYVRQAWFSCLLNLGLHPPPPTSAAQAVEFLSFGQCVWSLMGRFRASKEFAGGGQVSVTQ